VFVKIEEGRYGDVPLDGLSWGFLAAWPEAIHKGHGTFQLVVDERADARQRAALEVIGHGGDTDPGTLILHVFSTTVTTNLPPVFANIALDVDVDARTAHLRVGDRLESSATPITNPVTGKPHRIRVVLPAGFEYTEAEFASGTASATGPIALDFKATHAHVTQIHWGTHGVVR
jgi:hypothetical protein